MYYIYELVDPRNNVTRYIGITNNPEIRLNRHLGRYDGNEQKNNWIEEISNANLSIQMNVIETVETLEEARTQERHWIKVYSGRGILLYNIQGMPGVSAACIARSHLKTKQSTPISTEIKWRIAPEYYAHFDYPIEYLQDPGYLDNLFADWIDEMQTVDGRTYTEEDIKQELDVFTLSLSFTYSGICECGAIETWHKKQLEKM